MLGLGAPFQLERPREARTDFGPTMRRFPIWGLIWNGESVWTKRTGSQRLCCLHIGGYSPSSSRASRSSRGPGYENSYQSTGNVLGRSSFMEAIVAMVCSVKMAVQGAHYERDSNSVGSIKAWYDRRDTSALSAQRLYACTGDHPSISHHDELS